MLPEHGSHSSISIRRRFRCYSTATASRARPGTRPWTRHGGARSPNRASSLCTFFGRTRRCSSDQVRTGPWPTLRSPDTCPWRRVWNKWLLLAVYLSPGRCTLRRHGAAERDGLVPRNDRCEPHLLHGLLLRRSLQLSVGNHAQPQVRACAVYIESRHQMNVLSVRRVIAPVFCLSCALTDMLVGSLL